MRAAGGKMKAMDMLKAALAERQAKAQKVVAETGQKWVRRGELEQKRREEYLESKKQDEERQQAEEEAHFKKLEEHLTSRVPVEDVEEEKAIPSHILNDALLGDDDAEPPVSTEEVMERLRELAEPITLFGETNMVRYRRLRACEREIHEGKKNPDLVMLENVHMGQQMSALHNDFQEEQAVAENDEEEDEADTDEEKTGAAAAENDDKSDSEDEGGTGGAAGDKSDSEDEGDTAAQAKRAAQMQAAAAEARKGHGQEAAEAGQAQPSSAQIAADALAQLDLALMDKCDFIRGWVRKALKAWEKELADKPDDTKRTAVVKTEVAAHRQVRRDVRPLQKRLRLYTMDDFLLGKIHTIIGHADELDYRAASEAYLDLSIGKAAWPVGIGCGGSMLMEDAIGLHDRFNRNKQVKDIAYALNDDVTRKFVQALKRDRKSVV